jgi:hypothetical protein
LGTALTLSLGLLLARTPSAAESSSVEPSLLRKATA